MLGAGGAQADGGAPSLCPSPAQPSGDESRTLTVDDVTRSYVLHVPTAYDGTAPVPLVVQFHSLGRSGAEELADSPYPAALDPEGVVMAFPDGLPGPAGAAWNVGPCCVADVDDLGFVRALVSDVQATACIDASRIYAVGFLNGGGMAHQVGCQAADLFAAIAPAGADLLAENVADCTPARPVTVIAFRGTADQRVPYEGGYSALVPEMPLTFLGAEPTFRKWAEIDGCTGMPSPADANGCSSYTDCNAGAEVVLCTEEGGNALQGDPGVAWPVLQRHTL
jgi:polyhydroxybutyrate depolymerase